MRRLAWFSPMPPARSGVAVNSAELVAALTSAFDVDVYVDEPIAAHHRRDPRAGLPPIRSAHDFVWKHRLKPYDLTVYQLGNSSAHDFLWPYLFRYPGLAVLHDAHLHHARAAALLRLRRRSDYRVEFSANHTCASADLAELAVAGFDNHLYYAWPMTRLVAQSSRATAVHARLAAARLREEAPGAIVEAIRLGHGERLDPARLAAARHRVRRRHDIPDRAIVFGVFGGLTPDKRVPQVLDAFEALRPYAPDTHLLLVGAPAGHYDVEADVRSRGLAGVTITGFVDDASFTDYIAACDVSLNLRWPTAREMSGPWLRALAAGLPTVTIDLAHTADVPALDPRAWTVSHASPSLEVPAPVTVAIDILDEAHSLGLAMRRLAGDPDLRAQLSRAAIAYWEQEHSIEGMIEDYHRVIERALAAPAPDAPLPPHLTTIGDERLRELLGPFGLGTGLWSTV